MDIGPLQACASDGRSAAQIRKAKRQRRKENQDKLIAAQPLDHCHYFRRIKSSQDVDKPIEPSIGKNDNHRWDRNHLYETNTEENDNAVVSASSVLTIEGVKDSPVKSLRKKQSKD